MSNSANYENDGNPCYALCSVRSVSLWRAKVWGGGRLASLALCRTKTVLAGTSLLVVALVVAGCDLTGQYEKKFQEALQTAGHKALYDKYLHQDTVELAEANGKSLGVKLRLPKLFDNNTKTLNPSAPRAQPPFGDLPGLVNTRERQLDDAQGQFLPSYCYIAAVPKASQKADALQNAVAKQVAAALPGASWGDAVLKTPSGQSVTLKRLRGSGNQEFFNLTKNPPASVKIEGVFDLYLIDTPQAHVLVGWRCPKPQADKYEFLAATEAAMGTVEVETATGGEGNASNP